MDFRESSMENLGKLMTNTSRSFWKDKKVLITGHTGFKGSWLSFWLNSLGAKVFGLALDPQEESFFNTVRVNEVLEKDYRGDIRDRTLVLEVFHEVAPDIVFHLAAQPLVTDSYLDTPYTYETNVMGTVNILEAVKATVPKVAVIITTDKVYQNNEWIYPYRETDPFGGIDPYSASKACCEIIVNSYRESFLKNKTSLSTARAGNVFGGGDWSANRLIPDAIKSFVKKESLKIRNPSAIRPWQHVLEPLAGYMKLAENQWEDAVSYSEGWNFSSPNNEYSVGVVAKNIAELWGEGAKVIIESSHNNFHEAGLLKLDSTKARSLLGWNSRWSLEESIEKTVDWYKGYLSKKDMKAFSLTQIHEFMNSKN